MTETTQPEWSTWTAEDWQRHFASGGADDAEDGVTAELDAILAAEAERQRRATKRKKREEHDRQVMENKRRRETPTPVDAIASLPAFAERRPEIRPVPLERPWEARLGDTIDKLKGHAPTESFDLGRGAILVETKARPPVRGAAALLEHCERTFGVTFRLSPTGGLVMVSKGGYLMDGTREAIATIAPMIRSYLAGTPLSCAWCETDAVTLLFPDNVPTCETHAEPEVPTDA